MVYSRSIIIHIFILLDVNSCLWRGEEDFCSSFSLFRSSLSVFPFVHPLTPRYNLIPLVITMKYKMSTWVVTLLSLSLYWLIIFRSGHLVSKPFIGSRFSHKYLVIIFPSLDYLSLILISSPICILIKILFSSSNSFSFYFSIPCSLVFTFSSHVLSSFLACSLTHSSCLSFLSLSIVWNCTHTWIGSK